MRRTGLTKETLVGYITQAFFELLEKKPFNQLSVIEIVSLAGVSRSTYYRYFTCKEDIVKSFTKDVIQDCIAAYNKSEKAHSGDDTLQRQTWLLILFQFSSDINRRFYY